MIGCLVSKIEVSLRLGIPFWNAIHHISDRQLRGLMMVLCTHCDKSITYKENYNRIKYIQKNIVSSN